MNGLGIKSHIFNLVTGFLMSPNGGSETTFINHSLEQRDKISFCCLSEYTTIKSIGAFDASLTNRNKIDQQE